MKKIEKLTQYYYKEFERIGRLKDFQKIPAEYWVSVLKKMKAELFADLDTHFKLLHYERKQNFKKIKKQIKLTKNDKEPSWLLSSDLFEGDELVTKSQNFESILAEYKKKIDDLIANSNPAPETTAAPASTTATTESPTRSKGDTTAVLALETPAPSESTETAVPALIAATQSLDVPTEGETTAQAILALEATITPENATQSVTEQEREESESVTVVSKYCRKKYRQ